MRETMLMAFVLSVSAAAFAQAKILIPAPYLAPKYVAPPDAPSSIVIAGLKERGDRLVVTGRALDKGRPVAGVSIYVFHADADGLYSRDGRNSDENARLFGALRTDTKGRYRYETIRPHGYGDLSSHVHQVIKAPGTSPGCLICGSVTIRFFGAIAARVVTSLRRNSFVGSLEILRVSGT